VRVLGAYTLPGRFIRTCCFTDRHDTDEEEKALNGQPTVWLYRVAKNPVIGHF